MHYWLFKTYTSSLVIFRLNNSDVLGILVILSLSTSLYFPSTIFSLYFLTPLFRSSPYLTLLSLSIFTHYFLTIISLYFLFTFSLLSHSFSSLYFFILHSLHSMVLNCCCCRHNGRGWRNGIGPSQGYLGCRSLEFSFGPTTLLKCIEIQFLH